MALYKEKPRTTSGKIKRERESRKGIAREHNIIHTEMELFVEKLIKEKRVKYDREAKEFVFV